MGQAALSNEKQSAPFFCVYPNALPKAAEPPQPFSRGLSLFLLCLRRLARASFSWVR